MEYKHLKRLFKDSVIYGVSSIIARAINYILVPFYANFLTTAENGIQSILYMGIGFLIFAYGFGLDVAFMKFYNSSETSHSQTNQVLFSTSLITLFFSSALFSILIILFSQPISSFLNLQSSESSLYIKIAALILFFDTLGIISFSKLRIQGKANQYGLFKVLNVLVNVLSSIILVVYFKLGLEGAMLGNLISSIFTICFFLFDMGSNKFRFDFKVWKALILYGIPLIPNGLALVVIDFIDRFFLLRMSQSDISLLYGTHFTNEDVTGIYSRVYALGMSVQIFTQIFRISWVPFALARQHESYFKSLLSHIFLISTSLILLLSLTAAFLLPNIIQIKFFDAFYILPPVYFLGLSILPILFLSYIFDTLTINFTVGLLITKKTYILPLITSFGAISTLLSCIIFIPSYGMNGAAFSATIGTVIMSIFITIISLKHFSFFCDWITFSILFIFAITTYLLYTITSFNIFIFVVLPIFLIISAYVFINGLSKIKCHYS